jgi:NADH-quinone oxidoreductase subunit E
MGAESISEIVDRHAGHRGGLIAILQDIQARHGYLPADSLRTVAEKTGRPLIDVYGVATFYRSFSLRPRGKHVCSICLGTACHVNGAKGVADEFQRSLGISPAETTRDREFTLETVNCLGACAMGPIVVVDGHYFSHVSQSEVNDIVAAVRTGLDNVEVTDDRRVFPVEVSCARCNHNLMDPEHTVDGHPSIRVTVAFNGVHEHIHLSSLYGSYNVESEHEIPNDTVADFFCPHCHAHLVGSSNCPECRTPMVPMIVRGGGIVQICSRRGCRGHILDVGGPMF